MSKFVTDELMEIELGDGEWVKIPKAISFEDCQAFVIEPEPGKEFEYTLNLLVQFIKGWNFKDDDGNEVPLSEENIKKLKIDTIQVIQEHIIKIVPSEDKKKSKPELASSQKP